MIGVASCKVGISELNPQAEGICSLSLSIKYNLRVTEFILLTHFQWIDANN